MATTTINMHEPAINAIRTARDACRLDMKAATRWLLDEKAGRVGTDPAERKLRTAERDHLKATIDSMTASIVLLRADGRAAGNA